MWCGAALSCLLSVPQAVRVLRAERLDGISAATYVSVLSNAAVWAAWALLTGEYAAGVPGLINGPAAILIFASADDHPSQTSKSQVRKQLARACARQWECVSYPRRTRGHSGWTVQATP
jgi:uncharacterized protein with PQ loop repeat